MNNFRFFNETPGSTVFKYGRLECINLNNVERITENVHTINNARGVKQFNVVFHFISGNKMSVDLPENILHKLHSKIRGDKYV